MSVMKYLPRIYRIALPKRLQIYISSLVAKWSGSGIRIQNLQTSVNSMNLEISDLRLEIERNADLQAQVHSMSLEISDLRLEIERNAKHASNVFNSRENRLHEFVKKAAALAANNLEDAKVITSESSNCELGVFFDEYGSDKNSRHSYSEIYESLLTNRESPRILEIGLGSLNAFPYAGLKPGCSLSAWRKRYPSSFIVGADIDPESVSAVSEIAFVVDQTDSLSLDALSDKVTTYGQFDLIVDDGFHDPHANVQTLIKLLPHVRKRGAYVIEDVHSSLINFWRLVIAAMGLNGEVLDLSPLRPQTDDNVLVVIKGA